MGGILSLYLAERLGSKVKGVMLNDVGVSLHWVSLYSLYGGMKKSGALKDLNALAQKLNVREAVIAAVQLPTHFDLTYQRDWRGMHFDKVLRGFQGDVRLVRGKDSTVCLVAQVRELQRLWPQAQVLEVAHASHPVAFTPQVCAFFLTPFNSTATAQAQTGGQPSHAPVAPSALIHWWRRLRTGFRR
jgi:pimeloyl-ACP methyl ester carboxylesterase